MPKTAVAAAFVALLLSIPPSACAWGKLGHRVVAAIAEDRLRPNAAKRVQDLLGPRVSLADISACADDIKRHSITCGSFEVKENQRTKSYHFIDIPIRAAPSRATIKEYCTSHGREDQCAPAQIALELKILRDPKESVYQKQLALMFVVHLVGDIHQPLHAATDGDSGGNGKLVRFMQTARARKPTNLHHVWDNILFTDSQIKKLDLRAFVDHLEREIARKDTSPWTDGELVDHAALESFSIAKFKIYPSLAERGGVLGEDYQRQMQPVAFEQLEKAGVRLGELLNESLDPAAG